MVTRRSRFLAGVSAVIGGVFAACGGDGGMNPPPPPPPPIGPAISLNLGVGEAVTLTDPAEIRAFELEGGSPDREYRIIVQSASESFGGSVSGRLSIAATSASANVVDAGPRLRTPSFGNASGGTPSSRSGTGVPPA